MIYRYIPIYIYIRTIVIKYIIQTYIYIYIFYILIIYSTEYGLIYRLYILLSSIS